VAKTLLIINSLDMEEQIYQILSRMLGYSAEDLRSTAIPTPPFQIFAYVKLWGKVSVFATGW
jgi:hypothetical protein